jgi:hypothetical protein
VGVVLQSVAFIYLAMCALKRLWALPYAGCSRRLTVLLYYAHGSFETRKLVLPKPARTYATFTGIIFVLPAETIQPRESTVLAALQLRPCVSPLRVAVELEVDSILHPTKFSRRKILQLSEVNSGGSLV